MYVTYLSGMVTFHGAMGIDDWENLNGVFAQSVLQQGTVQAYNVPDGNFTTITGGKVNLFLFFIFHFSFLVS